MNYPEKLSVGDNIFDVVYEVSRGRGSSVRIKDRKVAIKLSRLSFGRARERTVEKFLNWASDKLSNVSLHHSVLPSYVDGGSICTHNKTYLLRIVREDRGRVSSLLKDGVIYIALPFTKTVDVNLLVDRLIIKDQMEYLSDVLNELNALHFQTSFNSCHFKKISSRFGSCSSKRNISIAFRLLFAPRDVFKYVCIHELAHLIEFNHSSRFWALVLEAMSNYKEQEKWLKYNGFMLG